MEVFMYSLKDTAQQSFMPAFTAPNDAVATRAVRNVVQKGDSLEGMNPGDFELYCLAKYDDQTGIVYSPDVPKFVTRVIDLVPVKQ